MFAIDTEINSSKIMEKHLVKVLFSMNIHQVANPEMSLEDARSYVFFFRENEKMHVCVGLYFSETGRELYYAHSSNPFSESSMADMEGDARAFAEDLGAMLDEIDFSHLSADEKKRWLAEQEMFSGRKKEQEKVPQTSGEARVVVEQPAPPAQSPAAPVAQPAPAPSAPAAVPVQAPPVRPAPPVQMPAIPAVHPGSAVAAAPIPVQMPTVQLPVPPAAPEPPVFPPVQQAKPSPPPLHKPQPGPSQQARVRQTPKPEQKTSNPAEPLNPPASGPEAEHGAVKRVDEFFDDAVKAGVVKAPKAQLKKDIRGATGTVSRDKEALARLLASF